MSLDLEQRVLLVKWMLDTLTAIRKDDLAPEAASEWVPGERRSVKLAGQHAGWVSLPKPTVTVSVDEPKLLPWAQANLPDRVTTAVQVAVDDDLIAWLRQHRPESLREAPALDPYWVDDVKSVVKARGHYVHPSTGEIVKELPGVRINESDPSPRVNLADDAVAVIAAAWRSGSIPIGDVLALPTPPDPAFGAPGDQLFFDDKGRFISPELAALHAVQVQHGYSTPARECRRMLADARRQADAEHEAMCAEWLTARGLSLDGDDEPA